MSDRELYDTPILDYLQQLEDETLHGQELMTELEGLPCYSWAEQCE